MVDIPCSVFYVRLQILGLLRTKETNTCANYYVNAWLCARRATDHDLENPRQEKMNAGICGSVIPDKKRKSFFLVFHADIVFWELITAVTFFSRNGFGDNLRISPVFFLADGMLMILLLHICGTCL